MRAFNCALIFFLTLKVECIHLENPEYGRVYYEGVNVGDKANYSCDYGYKLVGESVRKCLYNGYWSGELPQCKKSKRRSSKVHEIAYH